MSDNGPLCEAPPRRPLSEDGARLAGTAGRPAVFVSYHRSEFVKGGEDLLPK